MGNMNTYQIEKTCRACLKESEDMSSLIENDLGQMFTECTSLTVRKLPPTHLLIIDFIFSG